MKHQQSNGVCYRHCAACANERKKSKLKLQRLAMSAYHPEDYEPSTLTDHTVNEIGYLDGDSLALFIWHEVGEAQGDPFEAAKMINRAVEELTAVANKLLAACPSETVV